MIKIKKILLILSTLSILTACGNKESIQNENASTNSSKEYNLVPEEIKPENYIDEIDWSRLMRNPEKYKMLGIQAMGDVIQVIEGFEDEYNMYLLNEVRDGQGKTGNYFFAMIEPERLGEKLLKGDRIRMYGVFIDEYTYETVQGVKETSPVVYLHDYEIYFNSN